MILEKKVIAKIVHCGIRDLSRRVGKKWRKTLVLRCWRIAAHNAAIWVDEVSSWGSGGLTEKPVVEEGFYSCHNKTDRLV